ncbi:hypothetical protein AURDEDRAFT_114120 [Auricularia subglabra TFB-10046 SS5]|nr:hypothetical protein AURDEDRAFT_114120 [Auricularia subglabra TFB-10046 SS5]
MPFTPDDELELQFDPALIPAAAREGLHPELHLRPLARTDYARNHLRVLSALSSAPDIGPEAFDAQFAYVRAREGIYFTLVIIDRLTDLIVATGTVIVEQKFARNCARVAHYEDVAVDKAEQRQGRRTGAAIVQAIFAMGDARGCYMGVGNCVPRNVPFYEKLGMQLSQYQVARYRDAGATPSSKL